jgi:hypothetical protein
VNAANGAKRSCICASRGKLLAPGGLIRDEHQNPPPAIAENAAQTALLIGVI